MNPDRTIPSGLGAAGRNPEQAEPAVAGAGPASSPAWPDAAHTPLLLIAHAEGERTDGMKQARRALGLKAPIVVPYERLLAGVSLPDAAAEAGLPAGSVPFIRLDAPGEHFPVERALIALGSPERDDGDSLLPLRGRPDPYRLSLRASLALEERPMRLMHPSQWFRGFCRLLARIRAEAAAAWPQALFWNDPAEIAVMFDKRAAHRRLREAGVGVPALLAEPESLGGYEAVREAMAKRRMFRVFLKLAFGSGASGVIAYQVNPRTGAEIAATTLAVETYIQRPGIFYNTGSVRTLTDSESIRKLIGYLCGHGIHAERWIPKASLHGRALDLRQLVAFGAAGHSVIRAGETPITNLHLRSRRLSPAESGLPQETLEAARGEALAAMRTFPRSASAGIDVLTDRVSGRAYVADVNPFGDLLRRTQFEGLDPYAWENKRWLEAGAKQTDHAGNTGSAEHVEHVQHVQHVDPAVSRRTLHT
ncbi:STM4014 family protein [Saccharibacillus sp. CPCC 101409]|uniref:STM4014 family protein n=1 Tax=Saccharibacillus sp. CPCC 101409 TaxID=3058041 RepID=UPI00267364EE|nr:STM4014 family protein [Saccharibacillus sp. CPCC 101409]MDO3409558.1 STM4014 family protein [Saccharibacillus sp. CPCC 101409]